MSIYNYKLYLINLIERKVPHNPRTVVLMHIDLFCFSYQTLVFLWQVEDSGQCTTLPFPPEIS